MINQEIDGLTMGQVMGNLRAGPWSLSRYGDTELGCMVGARVANVDGQPVSAKAASDLWATLADPLGYCYGMQPLSLRLDLVPARIRKAVDWKNSDVLHIASIEGELGPFTEWLKDRRVALIGPKRLMPLGFLWTGGFIEVPLGGCYGDKDRVMEGVRGVLPRADVLICCASMLSNTVIHALYPEFGDRVSMIDCGSLWEPYAGIKTRRYHKSLSPETMEKNLGG